MHDLGAGSMNDTKWQLKTREVPGFRSKLLKRQGGKCGLCYEPVDRDQASLDHDHTTGQVRAVLHDYCDTIEGLINHAIRRTGIDRIVFLEALINYWKQEHDNMPLHPNHKTKKSRKRYEKRVKQEQDHV